jgi:creatinine amidohydrolase
METVFTGKMSWRQVQAALERGAAAFFAMGSTEEQGPHSPMGDYLAAEESTLRVAQETGDVVFPPLPLVTRNIFATFQEPLR